MNVNGNGATLLNLTASEFKHNTADQSNGTSAAGDGGALYVVGGGTWMTNNTSVHTALHTDFSNNVASGRGGALAYQHACFSNATVEGECA